jgi:hypothetical protein
MELEFPLTVLPVVGLDGAIKSAGVESFLHMVSIIEGKKGLLQCPLGK